MIENTTATAPEDDWVSAARRKLRQLEEAAAAAEVAAYDPGPHAADGQAEARASLRDEFLDQLAARPRGGRGDDGDGESASRL